MNTSALFGAATLVLGSLGYVAGAAAAGVGLVDWFWPAVAVLLIASASAVGALVQKAYPGQVVSLSERAKVVWPVCLASGADIADIFVGHQAGRAP